jgi:hypothetical protein
MASTESPYVVSHNFCAVRAETLPELNQRLDDFNNDQDLPGRIARFRANASIAPITTQAPLQVVTQVAPPAVIAAVPDVQQAVNNFNDAGITGQIVQGTATSIEQKEDKFGGKYTRGNPDAGDCSHGPRIYKDWRSKAGKQMQAFVCTNDSPFGNWKDTKCDLAWAN